MVRLTREYTRLYCLPRSASSSRWQQPHHHHHHQLRLQRAVAARCPGRFAQGLLVARLFPFLYPEATVVPTYTTCGRYHLAYPCTSHQHREPLRRGTQQLGCRHPLPKGEVSPPQLGSITSLVYPNRLGRESMSVVFLQAEHLLHPPPGRAIVTAHADDGRARVIISHQPLSSVVGAQIWVPASSFWNFTAVDGS